MTSLRCYDNSDNKFSSLSTALLQGNKIRSFDTFLNMGRGGWPVSQ